ncbi:3-hydroxyacyl-ACP dehydratase [Mycolicibacter heraklionensis]|nr:3-hydroxyacyl-ACP dehydratase [Mycolicibacter heraklionensis]
MAIKTDIRGMIWRYPEAFVVGREKIREFARSIKAEDSAYYDEEKAAELGHDALLAPPTFVATLAKLVQSDFFRHVDTGYTTMQMVQVDQGFKFFKPIKAGDKLYARMEIASVVERFGADIVTTRNILTDHEGDTVLEAFTTMMGHDGDSSVNLRWDAESGQVVRTA